MRKTITFGQLQKLMTELVAYQALVAKGKKTILTVAADKIKHSVLKAQAEYADMVELLRCDHGSVDEKENLIINEGSKGDDRFSFTAPKRKAFLAAVAKLEHEPVQIDSFIITQVPKNITDSMANAFRGILIPEDYQLPEPQFDEDGFLVEAGKGPKESPTEV